MNSKGSLRETIKRSFEADLECILLSDSSNDGEPEKRNKKKKSKEKSAAKKIRVSGNSSKYVDSDISKFAVNDSRRTKNLSDIWESMEELEQNYYRKIQVQSDVLTEFTMKVSEVYTKKIGDLLHKQEAEIEDFKRKFTTSLAEELENWEKYIHYVKQQEDKILKLLEQLRRVYDSSEIQNQKVRTISEMHKNFVQKYEELVKKHMTEASTLKDIVNKEISKVKNEFFMEMKMKESKAGQKSYTSFNFKGNDLF